MMTLTQLRKFRDDLYREVPHLAGKAKEAERVRDVATAAVKRCRPPQANDPIPCPRTAEQAVAVVEDRRRQDEGRTAAIIAAREAETAAHLAWETAVREHKAAVGQLEAAESAISERTAGGAIYSADFFDTRETTRPTWLVEGILVKGATAFIAGPEKCLKTSIALDLAISLATGSCFLGSFAVPEPCRVHFISGESGRATLAETARRIAASKRIPPADLADLNIRWAFSMPTMSPEGSSVFNSTSIRATSSDVVILDPLYLMMRDTPMSDLTKVGDVLGRVVQEVKPATVIFVHHFRKGMQPGRWPSMRQMAFAGSQEFARQWVLLNRRQAFKPGEDADVHRLMVVAGGSIGHNDRFALDINEGKLDPETFTGRTWNVSVESVPLASEADKSRAEATRETAADKHLARLLELWPADQNTLTATAARDLIRVSSTTLAAVVALGEERGELKQATKGKGKPLAITAAGRHRPTTGGGDGARNADATEEC